MDEANVQKFRTNMTLFSVTFFGATVRW